jgi:excisionase family DNA binding protein
MKLWQMCLLNQGDVADLLHVSVRTVARMRSRGELEFLRVCGRVRFEPLYMVEFLEARRKAGPGATSR